ncbi:cytochrome d ubiquinol oxidase subunit II [Eggerthellaceae bacterium zg-1084]|uniref:cytochrome d ubiquinol oxidase subunit II n=1 Tax=Berryella wangjianweii TaxID=2734634 RepID=UPI0015550DAC|nr:cytochrome d ubiquinol oxidase subunit II [Berryella wangjianweii]NPD31098.1 cytochrome d ubiquinol oxidase subunit II [Berryella wangjianweii]
MDFTPLQILWYFLIFLLIAGYFILDGFDLGVGVLSPFVAKNDEEKRICRAAIGPVWDGNEVWLLTAGGALFAAFAPAYATTFSGFYLAIMLVLFGLIVRVVGLEYAEHDKAWMKVWNVLFFAGSLFPALLTGVAVGNIYAGIPMDAAGNYIGIPLLGLVTPFTLLCGLLGMSMMLVSGASWLSVKAPLDSALYQRATKLRLPLQVVAGVLFLLVSAYAHFFINPSMAPELGFVRWAFVALFVTLFVAATLLGNKPGKELLGFILHSASIFCLVFLLATSMFPNLVVASPDSIGPTLSIANSIAHETTLFWMTLITAVGVPIVLGYHVFVYRLFRGRIALDELKESGY